MSDLSSDERTTLAQRLDEARAAVTEGRLEEAVDAVDAAASVVETNLPEGDVRARLSHGCSRIEDVADDEPQVAAEYCRTMRAIVTDEVADSGT